MKSFLSVLIFSILFFNFTYSQKLKREKKDKSFEICYTIKRDTYDIVFIQYNKYNKELMKQIFKDTSTNFKVGKAEDMNYISHNCDSLIKAGVIPGRILIQKPDKEYGLIMPYITHVKEDDSYLKKEEVGKFFIMRKYKN